MKDRQFQPMSIVPLGFTLSAFFVTTFVLCLLAALVLPAGGMRMIIEATVPGFVWLTASSVVFGLLWAAFLGWYIAVLFVPIRNFMYRRFS